MDLITANIHRLVDQRLAEALKPYESALRAVAEFTGSTVGGKRRGRPPGVLSAGRRSAGGKPCAIIDCERPSRNRGMCAAHSQKRRTDSLRPHKLLPESWHVAQPDPSSIHEVKLPRGRAAGSKKAPTLRAARTVRAQKSKR